MSLHAPESFSPLTPNGKVPGVALPGLDLLHDWPPPSREVLLDWLRDHGAVTHPALRIADMEDGSGWRVISDSDIGSFEILYSIPKTALLSARTSSLAALAPSLFPKSISEPNGLTNHTILQLSLCLLHEFRLGRESPFYGYIQSLPRNIKGFLLPMFWEVSELGGEDGVEGRRWLKGSEAERRIRAKEKERLGYADLQTYYTQTSTHLPPTTAHPTPSPFLAFIHAFSLISSRAFVIDLYRPTALVPFADILNHSSTPHTSLASDEFVCHICGSLSRCSHDPINPNGIPYRLLAADLGEKQREELAKLGGGGEDTVEMRAERQVEEGEEVWNSYGEIGDAGLLAEWGFLGGEYAGEGLTWEVDDVLEGDKGLEAVWCSLLELAHLGRGSHCVNSSNPFVPLDQGGHSADPSRRTGDENEDDSVLVAQPDSFRPNHLNLSLSGQLSFPLFLLLYLRSGSSSVSSSLSETSSHLDCNTNEITLRDVHRIVDEVEARYSQLECDSGAEDSEPEGAMGVEGLSDGAKVIIKTVLQFLEGVMGKMYRAELDAEQLLKLQDDLPTSSQYTRMALSLTADERSLIRSTIEKWGALVSSDNRNVV